MTRQTRAGALLEAEANCVAAVCATIEGKSWKAWIDPESVVERVGATGLEQAMEAGLE